MAHVYSTGDNEATRIAKQIRAILALLLLEARIMRERLVRIEEGSDRNEEALIVLQASLVLVEARMDHLVRG